MTIDPTSPTVPFSLSTSLTNIAAEALRHGLPLKGFFDATRQMARVDRVRRTALAIAPFGNGVGALRELRS